ncbi:MAG: hypothetical protein HC897_00945, partial [Thermoanaerobaculia bacterium]|nr:hypothetical protein [Thermoanaerobaculia bacterium]
MWWTAIVGFLLVSPGVAWAQTASTEERLGAAERQIEELRAAIETQAGQAFPKAELALDGELEREPA